MEKKKIKDSACKNNVLSAQRMNLEMHYYRLFRQGTVFLDEKKFNLDGPMVLDTVGIIFTFSPNDIFVVSLS